MSAYTYTTQRDLRRAFWREFPHLSRARGRDGDFLTDTRVSFCDWIDHLNKCGQISDNLANRATLED